MKPFIRCDQYNFIKKQAEMLISGYSSVNDKAVLAALKSLAIENVLNLFEEITEDQKILLTNIGEIKESLEAEKFLSEIKLLVIPFSTVSEQAIKKLFPKVKKLKAPDLDTIDFSETIYLGWNDKGTNKKYIVVNRGGKPVGFHGTFKPMNKKSMCAICNKLEEVGLFMTRTKGAALGTFTDRGNYICNDSQKCNHNITTLEKLNEFISIIKG